MWIKASSSASVLLCCALTVLAAVDQKKEDIRTKRNFQYSIAHHPAQRRISTGPQIPLYHSQFFPGPRSHSPYHKGRPYSLPAPPYAVQMEPLFHYSQRDPLFTTNLLSLNADGPQIGDDLLTDNNHLSEHVYGPQKHIVERPVYIKEPEPIIEIIIKESNVSLPAPPQPPPQPKKKEQVQVFYVKYKKNPNGSGKDAVIYDKPVPAISPTIPDEHEEEPPQHYHQEVITPPPPSTTLRTIIRPESETYHSPSGVKVTFGKEGFDYEKRSSKLEDLNSSPDESRNVQFPQGRQLSFPPNFPRRPPSFNNYQSQGPNFRAEPPRQTQPYRPFNQGPPQFRPSTQQYSTLPKQPRFPPSRPAPPQFQSGPPRQPVPYQPFETLRTQPPFRPQTYFPVSQQPPLTEKPRVFNQQFGNQQYQSFRPKPEPQRPQFQSQPEPQRFNNQFPPQPTPSTFNQEPQRQFQPQPNSGSFNQEPQRQQYQPQPTLGPFNQEPQRHIAQQYQPQPTQGTFHQEPQRQQFSGFNPDQQRHSPQQAFQSVEQHNHLQHTQNLVPPGGELIQALPKFEQHISVLEPNRNQQPQALPLQQQQSQQLNLLEYNQKIQQQLREANALQESIRKTVESYSTTTPRTTTTTTVKTTTTTTEEPEKPSTTTKDPKFLNLQLPDEVPDDLREQLLSSGILNNADISVLDYDKVGDIPLSALPPDQLANFYSAGGAQQIGGQASAPVPSVVDTDGSAVDEDAEASEVRAVTVKPEVQMKVVHYDPQSERGQQVQEAYVKDDATQVDPVVLNDQKYNRYLPLKVSGTQFPIPDVPELRGKKISSVVVLAPISYDFSSDRKTREVKKEDDIDLVQGDELKQLLKKPSKENFQKFLQHENQTRSDKQSVILLVIGPSDKSQQKEIFMYDVGTQTVSKLDGELSAAFVDAAEANASEETEDTEIAASNIVETRVPSPEGPQELDLESSASDFIDSKVPIIDPMEGDLETEASEHLESFVDVSGMPIEDDLTAAASDNSIGYRVSPL